MTSMDPVTEEATESVIQRVLGWVVDKVPVANNAEKERIKADIDSIFQTDEQLEAKTAASTYPVNGTPEQVRAWYATATDADIANLNVPAPVTPAPDSAGSQPVQ